MVSTRHDELQWQSTSHLKAHRRLDGPIYMIGYQLEPAACTASEFLCLKTCKVGQEIE